jgi:pimeloyl-ACP methyl ester carboxylesterase
VIAGHLARHDGRRVDRLVLVSPSGLGLPRGAGGEVRKWRHLVDPSERLAVHRGNLMASMIADPAHVDDLAVYVHAFSTERAKPVSAPISLGDTMRTCLPQVVAPLAAIWGAQDPVSAPFMVERRAFFQAIQADAPLEVIDGASHWVSFEAAPAFDALLLDLCAAR